MGCRRVEDAAHTDRFDPGFVRYIVSYRREMRARVLATLAAASCPVVRVRTRRQVRALADHVALLGRMPTSALGERDGR